MKLSTFSVCSIDLVITNWTFGQTAMHPSETRSSDPQVYKRIFQIRDIFNTLKK